MASKRKKNNLSNTQNSNVKVDTVLRFLSKNAINVPWIKKLILFGSRARGDFHSRSDYDIAVESTSNVSNYDWSKWAGDIKESIPTLCGIDLLLITESTEIELKKNHPGG
jgi:uncharacterized protein